MKLENYTEDMYIESTKKSRCCKIPPTTLVVGI